MSRTHLFLALALSLSAASACDEALDGEFGAGDDIALRPGFGSSGVKLNTSAIGDHRLHEINRKGDVHEDVQLIAVYILKTYKDKSELVKLDEVWSEKGMIYGRINDEIFKGAQFVGSRWDINTYGGGIVKRWMTVQKYRQDPSDGLHKYVFAYPKDATYGMHYYTKKYQSIKDSSLLAACGNESNEGIEAIVYENLHVDMKYGYVDEKESLLNIACLDGGVGKAGLWGYLPWEIGYYEFMGAIRMIRGDYCGDGDSWTKPGTMLDVEDKWGINTFVDPTSVTETLWTPKGAACVTLPRRPEFQLTGVQCGGWAVPDCKGGKLGDLDSLYWTKVP